MPEVIAIRNSLEEVITFFETHLDEFVLRAEAIMMAGSIYDKLNPLELELRCYGYLSSYVFFGYLDRHIITISYGPKDDIQYYTYFGKVVSLQKALASLDTFR